MSNFDDLAEQQLFAEIQASAKKARPQAHEPPPDSAVQNASLLNAARLGRLSTRIPSPSLSHTSDTPGHSGLVEVNSIARKGSAGKLKPVSFLRDDLARQPRKNLARRGDPFELGLSSPEKGTAKSSAKGSQKPPRKTRKKSIQQEVPQDPEESTPSIVPSDSGATEKEQFEAPETPSKTTGRLAGETPSRVDSSNVSGQRSNSSKRKAIDQLPEAQRRSKSPKEDGAHVTEEETRTIQTPNSNRSLRDKAMHPQVIVPVSGSPKRITRATKEKQSQAPMEEGGNDHEEHTTAGHQQVADDQLGAQGAHGLEHEPERKPPKSAQGPSGLSPEPTELQSRTRRKTRSSKPNSITNGLDMLSNEQEPEPEETERPQHRRQKKLRTSKNSDGQGIASEPEPPPQQLETKRLKGRPARASKNAENTGVASSLTNTVNEPSGRTRQTRSRAKSADHDPVPSAQLPHSENDDSRHVHPQSHNQDTRNAHDYLEKIFVSDDDEDEGDKDEEEDDNDEEDEEGDKDEEDNDEVAANVNGSLIAVEEDESQDEVDDDDSSVGHGVQLSDIDAVFKFLDSGKRKGRCQTEAAIAIKRTCQTMLAVLADADTTLDEVSTVTKNLNVKLTTYGALSDGKERKSLKVDAYGYLFRYLVTCLESLYGWFQQKYGDFQTTLEALRIITPFVLGIVAFKDKIADWKIKLPSRYTGDRLIKHVDIELIPPLRGLSNTYDTSLRELRDKAKKQRAHEEAAQRRREHEQRKQEKEELEALRVERKNRWIDLHVCRLRVEPDIRRRQALSLKQAYFDEKMATWTDDEMGRREERDANNVPFSRVDLFKKRLVPPAPPPTNGEREWTDEQMEALIDGLTKYAGPRVFQNIFKDYCRPGHPLRQFGVPEITAKAADVRLRLLMKYQEQDWKDVPQWIANIPLLP